MYNTDKCIYSDINITEHKSLLRVSGLSCCGYETSFGELLRSNLNKNLKIVEILTSKVNAHDAIVNLLSTNQTDITVTEMTATYERYKLEQFSDFLR